jgi:microcystin-dependent protein
MTTTYSHGIITYGSATINLPSITGNLAITNNNVPIGTIMAYAGNTTEPVGWFFCDGRAVLRTTYSALFLIIGIAYGGGDGINTFNLPKMISGTTSYGIFPAGSATTANTGFNIDGQLKISNIDVNTDQKIGANQIPAHTHTINHTHGIPSHNHTIPSHTHTFPSHNHSIPAHTHTITYAANNFYSSITIDKDTKMDTGGGGYRLKSSSYVTGTLPTSSGDTSITTTGDPSITTTGDPSITTTGDSVATTTDNSATITTGNSPSTQTDYVPNYTAFLWIIKYE